MSIQPTDEQLRSIIKTIFDKYDADKSGTLEAGEVKKIITDAFSSRSPGVKKEVTDKDVQQFLNHADQNSDGKVTQEELFHIFRKILNEGKPQNK
jgi:Ca2+-binding EF-hand superfamily protein